MELWSSLVSAHPSHKNMPAALLSTIDLLESELVKAKAALQEIQPNVAATAMQRDELAAGALAAYRQQLIGRAPDFYGSRRLSPKEIGLVPVVHEVSASDTESDDGEVSPPATATVTVMPPQRPSLVSVLSNSLILDHMAPYLSTPSLMSLSATSRALRATVLETPYVFRHLDLTRCRGAQLPEAQVMDEDVVTEDEYYAGPVRGIFDSLSRRSILQGVRTLVLDGLPVPADLIADIVLTDRFNINILSIRGCQHLNERKLMQLLQYAVRPTRPAGTPRVKGIYHFTPLPQDGKQCSPNTTTTTSSGEEDEQHPWYRPSGEIFKNIDKEWAQTIKKCEGIIAFDAVLCRGGHDDSQPAIANVALGHGCDGCHSTPEGPSAWRQSPLNHFPLLAPVPLHSSSVVAARRPVLSSSHPDPTFIARCTDCVTNRRCNRCSKWFCSTCLPQPVRISALSPHQTAIQGPRSVPDELERGVSKDCWECGPTCMACKIEVERSCQNCRGEYCLEHNEGCSSTMCDWCNTSTRHRFRGRLG